MTRFERAFVWMGGVLFVGSLAFCVSTYLIGWSRTVPQGRDVPLWSIAANALLFGAFAAHHSLLARDGVKRRLAALIPERLLRSVYVWIASLLLIVVCAAWRPIGGEVFAVTGWRAAAHTVVQLLGVWLIAYSVATIDPLELAGSRPPAKHDALQTGGPYRLVRHPLYLGWILAAFGAATMTGDRLAFAVISSLYLLIAIPWEERSLARLYPTEYEAYKRAVKWRVIPYIF